MLNNTTNNVMVSLWNCNFHFAVIYEFYIISQYPLKYYEKYMHYQVHIIYLPDYFILLQKFQWNPVCNFVLLRGTAHKFA